MTMIHLSYPRKSDFLYWDELGCLGKALGFPSDVFYKSIPQNLKRTRRGIDHKVFLEMIDFHKYFHVSLDKSFNKHSAEWNVKVIKRVLPLLYQNVCSFLDVQSVRVAFQTYEAEDSRGLPTDEKTLLRTLKMCNRMISVLKMKKHLKHMRPHLEEEGRIQLHELFDLILWGQEYEKATMITWNLLPTNRGLYQLEGMSPTLSHYDEKLQARLDAEYLKNESKLWRTQLIAKTSYDQDMPPVNRETRIQMVRLDSGQFKRLRCEIQQAEGRVQSAKAGNVRTRPITAPDLTPFSVEGNDDRSKAKDGRLSVLEIANAIRQRSSRSSCFTGSQPQATVACIPTVKLSTRTPSFVVVTKADVANTASQLQALKFYTATLGTKYDQQLDEDLKTLLPARVQTKAKNTAKDVMSTKRTWCCYSEDTNKTRIKNVENGREINKNAWEECMNYY